MIKAWNIVRKSLLLLIIAFTAMPAATQELMTALGHDKHIRKIIPANGGGSLITVADEQIKVWEWKTGRLLFDLRGHKGDNTDVVAASSSPFAWSINSDFTLRKWDLTTGRSLAMVKCPYYNNLYLAPGDTILCVIRQADILFYRATDLELLDTLRYKGVFGLIQNCYPLAGNRFAIHINDSIYGIDISQRKVLYRAGAKAGSGLRQKTDFLQGKDLLISAGTPCDSLRLTDLSGGKQLAMVRFNARIQAWCLAPDGTVVAVDKANVLYRYNPWSGKTRSDSLPASLRPYYGFLDMHRWNNSLVLQAYPSDNETRFIVLDTALRQQGEFAIPGGSPDNFLWEEHMAAMDIAERPDLVTNFRISFPFVVDAATLHPLNPDRHQVSFLSSVYIAGLLDSTVRKQASPEPRIFENFPAQRAFTTLQVSPHSKYYINRSYYDSSWLVLVPKAGKRAQKTDSIAVLTPTNSFQHISLFSPDDSFLLSANNGLVRIIRCADGKILYEKKTAADLSLVACAFAHGKFAFGLPGGSVQLYTPAKKLAQEFNVPEEIKTLSFASPDYIAIAGTSHAYGLNLSTKKCSALFSTSTIYLPYFDAQNNSLFTLMADGRILQFNLNTDSLLRTFSFPLPPEAPSFITSFSPTVPFLYVPDGRWLMSYTHDSIFRIWNIATGQEQFHSRKMAFLRQAVLKDKQDMVLLLMQPNSMEKGFAEMEAWNFRTGKFLFSDSSIAQGFKAKHAPAFDKLVREPVYINDTKKSSLGRELLSIHFDANYDRCLLAYSSLYCVRSVTDKNEEQWYSVGNERKHQLTSNGQGVMYLERNENKILLKRMELATGKTFSWETGMDYIHFLERIGSFFYLTAEAKTPVAKNLVLLFVQDSLLKLPMAQRNLYPEILLSPDSTELYIYDQDKTVWLYSIRQKKLLAEFAGTWHLPQFSPDNKWLMLPGNDTRASVFYDRRTGQRKNILIPYSYGFSYLGSDLVSSTDGPGSYLVDLQKATRKYVPGNILAHTDSGFIETSAYDISRLDSALHTQKSLPFQHIEIREVVCEPGGGIAYSVGADDNLIKWNTTDHIPLAIATTPASKQRWLYFNSDSTLTVIYDDLQGVVYRRKDLSVKYSFIPDQHFGLSFFTPDQYYLVRKSQLPNYYFRKGNRLWDFAQFDMARNRPDIVLTRMNIKNPRLIESYHTAWLKRIRRSGMRPGDFDADLAVPETEVLNATQISAVTVDSVVSLSIRIEDKQYKLHSLLLYVNGCPLVNPVVITATKNWQGNVSIPLSVGANTIQVSCLNEKGVESLKEFVHIAFQPKTPLKKPRLFFIGIGVSNYRDSSMNLQYAAKDIRDLDQIFKEHHGANYRSLIFLDRDAVIPNLGQIKDLLRETQVDDQVIISVSGHGLLDKKNNFYLATYDINFSNPAAGGLLYDSLEAVLDNVSSRHKLLLIDACHSGEIDQNVQLSNDTAGHVKVYASKGIVPKTDSASLGLQNSFELMKELFADLSASNGTVVVSAAGGLEYALEDKQYRNGVFTYCIKKGLVEKEADTNGDEEITVNELRDYVAKNVERLTRGRQRPTTRRETINFDWRIW
jgi:WD40 repeat protein